MTTALLLYFGKLMTYLDRSPKISAEHGTCSYAKDGVVCNIGDLLQRWTNDYFKSTKHRVVNPHIDPRALEYAHFVDPKPGTIVQNLTDQLCQV